VTAAAIASAGTAAIITSDGAIEIRIGMEDSSTDGEGPRRGPGGATLRDSPRSAVVQSIEMCAVGRA
jgi:hypothetical protein